MARRGGGVALEVKLAAKGNVDLLRTGLVDNVEPGEAAALESRDGHGGEAEGVTVKGVGGVERVAWHDEIDVGDACNRHIA